MTAAGSWLGGRCSRPWCGRIRNRDREIPLPRFISRLRAVCVVQAVVGWAVTVLRRALLADGRGQIPFGDLVKVTIFLADMDDLQLVNKVYSELVPEPRSARPCVAVAKLPFDGRVEIEFVAAVPTEL